MEKKMWFVRDEYVARVGRIQASLREQGLDMFLAYQPESVTYLTGFFTNGYHTSFTFAIIPVDRDPIVVTRLAEQYYLDVTGAFDDRELWSDGDDLDIIAVAAIKKAGGASARIGLEMCAWPLNARRYEALRGGLPNAELVDASNMAARLRLIKSPAEIAYMRRAARAAEAGMAAAAAAAKVGVSEREVAVAVAVAQIRAGSDIAEPGPLASGDRAFHIHGVYSDRVLKTGDTMHNEMSTHVRNYYARFMRPIKVGRATDEERDLARQLIAVQDRAVAEVAPGVSATIPDRIYREGILATGAVKEYVNKTFYSLGFLLLPTTFEPLEATPNCHWKFEVGMTFHTYLVVRGMCFSETILVTEDGCELLTNYPRQLIVT